jgi:hypothetical protein
MYFLIKRGKHFSNRFFYKLFNFFNFSGHSIYLIKFDETCKYQLPKEDQADINKLFGFSLGLHHKNSARFGWCWNNNQLEIWAYWYNNGFRNYQFIQSIDVEEKYYFEIKNLGDKWEFSIHNYEKIKKVVVDKSKTKINFGYNLWPYFGGNQVSPQDISIYMIDFSD